MYMAIYIDIHTRSHQLLQEPVKSRESLVRINICTYIKMEQIQIEKKGKKGGLSAYTARSSFKLFSIATNACMWMLTKQGERRIKKVMKCIHLMQFAKHIYLLFWAKDHFHLTRRPDILISR